MNRQGKSTNGMHRFTAIFSGRELRARLTLSLEVYGHSGSGRSTPVFDSLMMPSLNSCE